MSDEIDIALDIDVNINIAEEEPEVPSDIESDAKRQLSETHAKAKEKRHEYENRMAFEGDMGAYLTIVFRSNKERLAFMQKHSINSLLDDPVYVFYDDIKENL